MIAEPRTRRDGRCVVCGKPRQIRPQKGVALEVYEGDPFCSNVCARSYFGNPLSKDGPSAKDGERRGRHARAAA